MAAGGATKGMFTDREISLFKPVYNKIVNGEWDTAKAGRYFKGHLPTITKFNQFCEVTRQAELERLLAERNELLATDAALAARSEYLVQSIKQHQANIEAASAEFAETIIKRSSSITVPR